MWVTQRQTDLVSRFDPASGEVTASITVQDTPSVLSFGGGALWVGGEGGLARIDPATNEMTTVRDDLGNVAGVAATDDVIWVSLYEQNVVLALDPATGAEQGRAEVGTNPDPVVVTSSGVWVANRTDGTVSRIDPADFSVGLTLEVPGQPTALAVDGDRLWVATTLGPDAGLGSVSLIDHAADEPTVVKSIEVGRHPLGVTTSEGRVWVAAHRDDAVARVEVS